MKTRYLYCVILVFLKCLISSNIAYSNFISTDSDIAKTDGPEYLPQGTYLVIGVFAYEDNAQDFSQYAQMQGVSAKYAYYPSNGYYYVYTFTADSASQVVNQCLRLRDSSEFEDAWVFKAYGSGSDGNSNTSVTDGWDSSDWGEVNVPIEKTREATSIETIEHTSLASEVEAPPMVSLPKKEKTEPAYDVYFRTIGETDKPVTALVKVVDGSHAKVIKNCQANQPELLEHSRLMTKQVQLITYAIGYRKATFDLSLDQPINDSSASYVAVNDETIEVKMELEKLKRGDVQVMYNTYFYGNASVMREKSRYEIEELLRYLRESPTAKIKLHGHTNGNSRGVTYLYLKEHGNFFNIRRNGDYIKRGVGAKKLSQMRAETIRQYLIKQGIDESRIETKGWGGANMLYDADSPLAKNNIRVEIEVLSE